MGNPFRIAIEVINETGLRHDAWLEDNESACAVGVLGIALMKEHGLDVEWGNLTSLHREVAQLCIAATAHLYVYDGYDGTVLPLSECIRHILADALIPSHTLSEMNPLSVWFEGTAGGARLGRQATTSEVITLYSELAEQYDKEGDAMFEKARRVLHNATQEAAV